jgi:uncharacterized damage-inducible protein DinB
MAIHKSVKEAWQTNARINQSLLDHLTPEMLQAKTPGSGLTVDEHLVEILYNPKYFGLKFAPEMLESLPNLHEMDGDEFIAESDLSKFREAAPNIAQNILEAADTATNKGSLPHTDLDIYLIHMMVHDAHHRGQPNDKLIWLPWRNE